MEVVGADEAAHPLRHRRPDVSMLGRSQLHQVGLRWLAASIIHIPLAWVDTVDERVHLSVDAEEAIADWETEESD